MICKLESTGNPCVGAKQAPTTPLPTLLAEKTMDIGALKCYPVLVWQGLCSLLLCNGHKIYHCV